MLKTILVDDEKNNLELLQYLMKNIALNYRLYQLV